MFNSLSSFLKILAVFAMVHANFWLFTGMTAANYVLLLLGIGLLTGFWFATDTRRYPVCPQCLDNLSSRRNRLLRSEAHCIRHGDFVPHV